MSMKKGISLLMISTLLVVLLASSLAGQVKAASGWRVTITASLASYTSDTVLGVETDATDGFDTAYDQLVSPAPMTGVYSYFYYPSNPSSPVDLRKLSTSVIPESPSMTWTLRVQPIGLDGTMTLSWTTIPPQYNGYIKDSTGTTTLADMNAVSQYQYEADADIIIVFQVNLVIPEYPHGILLALTLCFASYGILKIRKHPKPF
jgi:hypothetical protein